MQKARRTRPLPVPTRQRLLDAAARVFARDGLAGATTRAIAHEAGVNEVTLFRHFQTKERLLNAVVGQTFAPSEASSETIPAETTSDLSADLVNYARRYEARLVENLPLVRAMLGEIHRHRACERTALHGIFKPLRLFLVTRLEKARADRVLRRDVEPAIVADLFNATIFTGALRRASSLAPTEYSPDEYLKASVDLLLRGIT